MAQSKNGYAFHNVIGKAWEVANNLEGDIRMFQWNGDEDTPEKALDQWHNIQEQASLLRSRMREVETYLQVAHNLWDYTPEEDVSRETSEEEFNPFKDVPPVDPADFPAQTYWYCKTHRVTVEARGNSYYCHMCDGTPGEIVDIDDSGIKQVLVTD